MTSGPFNMYGGYLILDGLDKKTINSWYRNNLENNINYKSQEEAIKSFKNYIRTVKKNGVFKYLDLLEKDKSGNIVWKHSDKYYCTFFTVLGSLLNSSISLVDIDNVGISEDGKIWGGRLNLDKSPKPLNKSKYDFQTLIYRYIFRMNYDQLNGNRELAKRV